MKTLLTIAAAFSGLFVAWRFFFCEIRPVK
jgi:hypothetical protein